jgi:hypothetical protein
MANALDNPKPIEEWDDEELRQGRIRNSKGTFAGKPPRIPPHIFRAIRSEETRRKLLHAADIVRDSLEDAVSLWREIVNDPSAKESDRLKASELIAERAWGKAITPVVVGRTTDAEKAPWELAVDDFVLAMGDEKLNRARQINSGQETVVTRAQPYEGTSRPASGGYDYRDDDRPAEEPKRPAGVQSLDEIIRELI